MAEHLGQGYATKSIAQIRFRSLNATDVSPRDSFQRFPSIIQTVLTILSGKAARHETPAVKITPQMAIFVDFTKVVAGVVGAISFIYFGGFWDLLLPFAWLLTVNGARSLASDAHYAAHACVTGHPRRDHWIGEAITAFIMAFNMDDYGPGHVVSHHGRDGISTERDPDLGLMFVIGFETGRRVGWYKRRLALTLISPRFHFVYYLGRLRSNLLTAKPGRRLFTFVIQGPPLFFCLYYNLWSYYLLTWVVPIVPLFAMSAALQVPSEHLWLAERSEAEPRVRFVRRLSHGRFFLVTAPPRDGGVQAWVVWLGRMVLPMLERFFVCVSILPAHDFHHRHARIMDWPLEPYLRQKAIDEGEVDYRDYYGLSGAYLDQFEIWSALPRGMGNRPFTFLRCLETFLAAHLGPAPAEKRRPIDGPIDPRPEVAASVRSGSSAAELPDKLNLIVNHSGVGPRVPS